MAETVQGFDSRYWNGILPSIYSYKFVLLKATESDWFTSPEFENQLASAKQIFGDMWGAFHFYRYYNRHGQMSDPILQAKHYYDTIMETGGLGAFPPIVDLEDIWAPPSLKMVNHMNAVVLEIESLFGMPALIYTANWWWSRHAEPYVQPLHVFYKRLLWESDPPPDTKEPGEWTKAQTVMVQTVLDWSAPGFNAKIDVNEANQDWFDSLSSNLPSPDPLEEAIERAELVLQYLKSRR